MQLFTLLKGNVQGAFIILPGVLTLKLVGDEGTLGTIGTAGAILSTVTVYFVGRYSRPRHRVRILAVGISLFVVSAVIHSLLFSVISVLIFAAIQITSNPLMNVAYYPMMMKAMNVAAKEDKRNEYAYIFNNEILLNLGRILGCAIFLGMYRWVSQDFALRHFLLITALLQLLSLAVAKKLPWEDKRAIDG